MQLSLNDWRRVAQPQEDGSDSTVYRAGAAERWQHVPGTVVGDPRLWGTVALRRLGRSLAPDIIDAPLDHPALAEIEALVRLWPAGETAVRELIDVISPVTKETHEGQGIHGSICGHEDVGPGRPLQIVITTFDPIGGAEAVLHETGHLRLKCLGVDLETHDGTLLKNADDELFPSPVRFDKLRPMPAVLHGLYSWVMLSQQDLAVGATEPARVVPYLEINVPKIENGLATVRAHAKLTAAGVAFLDGFFLWAEQVVTHGHALVAAQGNA